MDIETKEAVLKLAGYVVRDTSDGIRVRNRHMFYEVITDTPSADEPIELLSQATTRDVAIKLAYNTFLTRQNDVS